jgi:hypothetical protein
MKRFCLLLPWALSWTCCCTFSLNAVTATSWRLISSKRLCLPWSTRQATSQYIALHSNPLR